MDAGLLIIRVAVGSLLFVHGSRERFGRFGGIALGGILLTAGFLTPLVAAMIIGMMLNAILSAKRDQGLISGYELELVYATVAAGLAFTGAGAYSVDALLPWTLSGVWGIGAIALGVFTGILTLWPRRSQRAVVEVVSEGRRAA